MVFAPSERLHKATANPFVDIATTGEPATWPGAERSTGVGHAVSPTPRAETCAVPLVAFSKTATDGPPALAASETKPALSPAFDTSPGASHAGVAEARPGITNAVATRALNNTNQRATAPAQRRSRPGVLAACPPLDCA
jgi:hypothetical protein